MKPNEIAIHDLKNESATVMAKIIHLDNFLIEHEGGLEYEDKRLIRTQRAILFSYATALDARINNLKNEKEN